MKINTRVFGSHREIYVDGRTYAIDPNLAADRNPNQDRWRYTLPNGKTYTHPTEFGCLLMILKDIGGGEWAE